MTTVSSNEALLEASRVINSSLDLRVTLQSIAEQSARVLGAEASSVLLLDERTNKLVFKAAFGQKADELINQVFDANLGIAGRVVKERKSSIVNDVHQNSHFLADFDDRLDFKTRNIICSPMIFQDKVIGVIEVLNSPKEQGFDREDVQLIEVFANLAAIGTVNALRFEGLKRQNEGLKLASRAEEEIIGADTSLADILMLVNKVAHTNATVLLLGETGTGKELIARTIHNRSPRADFPFVAINCAALPENLLESELFGHEKGSFTGAVSQKLGRFELADGGTIFLDEVGELSPAIQVKLLRVLQEKEFVRVGGTKTISTDVRIIAATNRDLKQAITDGTFREDLYYRLNVFPICLPPLRERRGDIPAMVNYYIGRISADLKVPAPEVTPEVLDMLINYDWPGNIRELQNIIERAVLLAGGAKITPAELPKEISGNQKLNIAVVSSDTNLTLPEQEKMIILRALEQTGWNQTRAAKQLGVSRDHLRYRIKKFKLKKPKEERGKD